MKIFSKVKEIKSKTDELYFERWAIIETFIFSIYIHRIHRADKDVHLHSHPWNFLGIILKGAYTEKSKQNESYILTARKFLSCFWGSRKYFHKIETIDSGPVYSLFFIFGKHMPWYYNTMPPTESIEYRKLKNANNLPV
jgi:hypothetical protein